MKRALLFLTMLSFALFARADDQTQAVQQALKDQGFYYGTVDGQGGPETDAAVRRYQIRQGLDVTGKLDEETLDSLHLGAGGKKDGNTLEAVNPPSDVADDSVPNTTPVPKNVEQSDHDFLRQHPRATPAPPPDTDDDNTAPQPAPARSPAMSVVPDDEVESARPSEPAPPSQPDYTGQTQPSDYVHFFRKTPYETAPPPVQRSTIGRAQARLAHEGFYRGPADGQLSDALTRAIDAYQHYAELSKTGRLDMETLQDMDLLPRRRVIVAPQPYYGPPPDGRGVYRGIWVH